MTTLRAGAAAPETAELNVAMLRHVSPIEWDNVVLYGQYVLNRRLARVREVRDGNP